MIIKIIIVKDEVEGDDHGGSNIHAEARQGQPEGVIQLCLWDKC